MQKHPPLPQAFADLGIETNLLKGLQKVGFTTPTDIQEAMIPPALKGHDILGQARTGTGKTAAFGLPVLQLLEPAGRLQALCLVPTRELAVQVAGELKRLNLFCPTHVVAVYGGKKRSVQQHELGRKPHFVVGTPGRVMDFMQDGSLDFSGVRFAILDEVDRMLDIGFRDDIRRILGRAPDKRQTIFVSATIDDEIKRLAGRYMKDPLELDVSRDQITVEDVEQYYITAEQPEKFRLLKQILKEDDPRLAIIFCNTKMMVRKLVKKLHDAGTDAMAIEGDLIQRKREQVMNRFRRHQIQVLVATDLAARGIDVSAITHIFNYDIPFDPEVYVHRIGRTARMGAKGIAVTFVTREEGPRLTNIETLINREVPQRQVDGFVSKPTPPRAEPKPRPAPISRNKAAVFAGETTEEKLPPKTLGSRFRTRRSKRRL